MPDNCTEIRVFQLSIEAQNRLGGATEAVLDLPSQFSIRLSKDVEKLSVVNKIAIEGALGFGLPFSRVNDAVFCDYTTPLTLDNQNKFYTVRIMVSGNALQFNRLSIKGKNDRTGMWEVELRNPPEHWAEVLQTVKLSDLDYGKFFLNRANIEANWQLPVYEGDHKDPNSGQAPYYWPLLDFCGWCDQTLPLQQNPDRMVKAVAVEDFRPLISLAYILKAGACAAGWTIEGRILETEWFKRLWVYALRPDYYVASTMGGRIIGRTYVRTEPKNTISTCIRFADLVQGEGSYPLPAFSGGYLMGIYNFQGVALKYRFAINASFTNEKAVELTATIRVMEVAPNGNGDLFFTGEILSDVQTEVFSAGQTKQIIYEREVTLQRYQRAAILIVYSPTPYGQFFMEAGSFFSVTPQNQSLMTLDNVDVRLCVSDKTTVLDWLKAVTNLIDGRLETDWETKTITIHPNRKSEVFGETVPGFLLEESAAIDISKMILSKSILSKQVRPDLKRYTRLEFSDSTDAHIQNLNLSEPAHSRTIFNGVQYPDEIESIQNPLIEPTLEGQPLQLSPGDYYDVFYTILPFLPRLWDNTSGERSFEIAPRILFAYGEISQPGATYLFDTSPFGDGAGPVSLFGYATQLRTQTISPTPTLDGNVVFGSEQNDLFVNFYLGITQNSRGGVLIDLLMFMRMKDYVGYNFRQMFTFSYKGVPVRVPMQGIRDFASCDEIPTPVTFFVAPAETECCDLPCGCQFMTCEYYQDFGIYLQQVTLDSLKIASFIVDGIELITTPVSLGLINIIEINGMSFVTNLVDALNSIGAPYFTFSISTRTHPERGKRYFKIKRLACVPFRILITLSGLECYLYTQDEQKQKYFQGTWEALGYGATTHETPIDCETQTEY